MAQQQRLGRRRSTTREHISDVATARDAFDTRVG